MLDWVARVLGIPALRPPPHLSGSHAKQVEVRSLDELRRGDVPVLEVEGEGHAILLLSGMGMSRSSCLRKVKGDDAVRNHLIVSAIKAISEAHSRGHYLGQPVPRNVVTGKAGIGFIDFEEDPAAVMSLADAQTRDWILFVHGAARYYPTQCQVLAELICRGIASANPTVA